jgi:predicted 3-demethylubiquinone-9 3-methyltransferase (glyoxalase superfamily)
MTVLFTLRGRTFLALNGGPRFTFSEAVSFQVMCRDQEEVDRFWAGLGEGGRHGPCGWLTDRFGLSWQVVPEMLPHVLAGPDHARAQRVMAAMLGMGRLDVAALEAAAEAG